MCQAFDDSHNLESVFKLISIVGTVLGKNLFLLAVELIITLKFFTERPKIKEEFTYKYQQILIMLDDEM